MSDILVDRSHPGIAVVTLNRPDRSNSLTWPMIEELSHTIDRLAFDHSRRVVVLTGAGANFCTGLDLRAAAEGAMAPPALAGLEPTTAHLRSALFLGDIVTKLRRLPQPVVGAINGKTLGGGFALSIACDLRVAAPTASFGVQFIKAGLSGAEMGVSYLLPRLIGASRAAELIFTGRIIDVAEADRIGLVSQLADDPVAAALSLAESLLAFSPFGLSMTKQVLWSNLSAPSIEAAIELESRTQVLAGVSGDFAEAITAFAERRRPSYRSTPQDSR